MSWITVICTPWVVLCILFAGEIGAKLLGAVGFISLTFFNTMDTKLIGELLALNRELIDRLHGQMSETFSPSSED